VYYGTRHREAAVTEQKSSIFGFLKNALTEEVPDGPEPAAGKPGQPPGKSPAPAFQTNAVHVGVGGVAVPHAGVAPAAPDGAALAKLEARLQQSVPPVYAAFMEQYDALRDVIADETVRFKAALKTSHANADQIIASLDQLLSSMDTAHNDFTKSFEGNKGKVLGQLEQAITATQELIKTREQQVQAIQNEIASLHAKVDTDAARAQSEGTRLEGIRAGFEAAHAQVVGRLTAQKNRIAAMPKG
jgi:hypothetical protein